MNTRQVLFCAVSVTMLANDSAALRPQTAPEPTAYTVTANNTMAGPVTVTKTSRLGSKVVVNERTPAPVAGGAMNVRTLYLLNKMEKFTWDPVNSSVACVKETFSGDWGDPFTGAGDLAKGGAKQVGTENLHGFSTTVLETAPSPSGTMKAWVDTKTNMVVKAQLTPPGGAPVTMIEIMDVSLAPPPASDFALPANCGDTALAQAANPRPPGETDEIASFTGGDGQDFLNGIYGPGSRNSCAMVFRVVHAGTMAPIASGFQVGVDLDVTTESSPSYAIGVSTAGRSTFKGGGLHEIASQTRNGVFRIDNVPAQFYMDIEFGSPGSASANLYRQCSAPQTVLLYVVKDPADISRGGDWLWVKSGKYAAVAP